MYVFVPLNRRVVVAVAAGFSDTLLVPLDIE